MKTIVIAFVLFLTLGLFASVGTDISPDTTYAEGTKIATQSGRISIRTENYPRPPYSGATYYIYERDGEVVCTKLEVCNKYDDCTTTYKKGSFKDDIDVETGDPYGKTDAVFIPKTKLKKHVCLTKFKLIR